MLDKKILYVGNINNDSTSNSRRKALKKNFKKLDIIKTENSTKLSYKVRNRIGFNSQKKINHILSNFKYCSFDIIWFDKPTYIDLDVLESIKKNNNLILVCHITDDIDNKNHNWKKFLKAMHLFDFIFSSNKLNVQKYYNFNIYYNELGYDDEDYKYNNQEIIFNKKKSYISFFGHYEKPYCKRIKEFAKNLSKNKLINIGGQGWWKDPSIILYNNIKLKYGWITKSEMINIYKNSIASLGLYSELNRNISSGRIFEMAALGVPIIAVQNNFLDNLLEENYIKLSDDYNKINQQLSDVNFLNSIRKKANNLIIQKKCSWTDRTMECLKIIGYEN